jgi:hypothetical protein
MKINNAILQGSVAAVILFTLTGCATTIAVADIVGSTVIYTGKTIVKTIDAVTPDIRSD